MCVMHSTNLMKWVQWLFVDNNYTFQSKDKQSRMIKDYIFVPELIAPGVKYKEIFQEFSCDFSDHFPLLCRIYFANVFPQLPPDCSRNITRWKLDDITKLAELKVHEMNFKCIWKRYTVSSTDDIDEIISLYT